MRADTAGLFWDDTPVAKVLKEKIKRTPPARVWEEPGYLPGLDEARRFPVQMFTDAELVQAARDGHTLVVDTECYDNYWLCAFMSLQTGQVIYFEKGFCIDLDYARLGWVMANFRTVSFNGIKYDLPMITLALAGYDTHQLKEFTNRMIVQEERAWNLLRACKLRQPDWNHIDTIEVAPLSASLKIYGGRLHAPRMQDLPFHPDTCLSIDQATIVRWYCVNDLINTAYVFAALEEQISLRERLSVKYGIDLRSKSDAQIAEAVIAQEVGRLNGTKVKRPEILVGDSFRYTPAPWLQFQSDTLRWLLDKITNMTFVVGESGHIDLPEELKSIKINVGHSTYQLGIGGLHSTESSVCHWADENTILRDVDVISYYPEIMLKTRLYPEQMGPNFLVVFGGIVDTRKADKRAKRVADAQSGKIIVNGAYGKTSDPYSYMYSPRLQMQVCITGELSLLLLAERLELAGIPVVSGNTDGLVIKCPKHLNDLCLSIIKQWEKDTGFETEETIYKLIASRDVNNYVAVKEDGSVKAKGAYANPWNEPKEAIFRFHINPTTQICAEAVAAYLSKGTPLISTIRGTRDASKFVSIRKVGNGGAVKVDKRPPPLIEPELRPEYLRRNGWHQIDGGYWIREGATERGGATLDGAYEAQRHSSAETEHIQYLGKAIRWYYAKDEPGFFVIANSGNKVPKTDGARPLMDLPQYVPDDIDYEWYEAEAYEMLVAMGVMAEAPVRHAEELQQA